MADYNIIGSRGVFKVLRTDASRASSTHSTQYEAIEAAKTYSANSGGGEVSIHRVDNNRIRQKNTVKPGNDPSHIKG